MKSARLAWIVVVAAPMPAHAQVIQTELVSVAGAPVDLDLVVD